MFHVKHKENIKLFSFIIVLKNVIIKQYEVIICIKHYIENIDLIILKK